MTMPKNGHECRIPAAGNKLEDEQSRRAFAGIIGGLAAAALAACQPSGQGEDLAEASDKSVTSVTEALSGTLQVAASCVELRGLAGDAGSLAVVKGLNSEGDGQPGLFYWSSVARTDDGLHILNPTTAAGAASSDTASSALRVELRGLAADFDDVRARSDVRQHALLGADPFEKRDRLQTLADLTQPVTRVIVDLV